MNDLSTMLRQQMQKGLETSLDAAVQAGDIQAARKATKDILDLSLAEARLTSAGKKAPTPAEIKAAVTAKADWFGVDPRKTAKAMELAKMMDPARFESAEAFATALLKTLDDEGKSAADPGEDEDDEDNDPDSEGGDIDDEDEGGTARQRRPRKERKNGTPVTELNAGTRGSGAGPNLRRAFETGDVKALPKTAQDDIKAKAEKFVRTGTKEQIEKQRATFVANAVKAHARAQLIATGKFDGRTNKFIGK